MNVSLTKKQEEYIASQIAGGDYQNASELVRDALRMHQVYREKVLTDLRREIDKGLEGPFEETTAELIVADVIEKYKTRESK
jgi:antitoxin ParD1/3/4